MQFSPYITPDGYFDGTQESVAESLYLLTEDYRIIGMRPSAQMGDQATTPHIGDAFFKCFPAAKEERGVLERLRRSPMEAPVLMRAGNRPVLMLCSFFARTRLLIAIVPTGQVREILDTPDAYVDALNWLYFSPEMQMRHRPSDEQDYACIAHWLNTIKPTLLLDNRENLKSSEIVRWLLRLTSLCGCRLSYDLRALEFRALPEISVACLVGTCFAAFLTAYGEASKATLHLAAGYDRALDYLLFEIAWMRQDTQALPAFCETLAEEANIRGAFFATYASPQNDSGFCVRFSPSRQELSKQQIKALTQKPTCWGIVVVQDITRPAPDATPNEPESLC